jgi:hypothetical protein
MGSEEAEKKFVDMVMRNQDAYSDDIVNLAYQISILECFGVKKAWRDMRKQQQQEAERNA